MADSIDDFLSGKSVAPAESTPAAPDHIDRFLTGDTTPPGGATAPPPEDNRIRFDPARLAIVGNSFVRGLHNALDIPAEALARGGDWVARQFGANTRYAQDTAAADAAAKAAYDADPANQGFGPATARFAGTLAGTLPAAMATGGLATAGTGLAATAAGVGGNLLTRAAPVLAGGAAGGATAAAQTGEPIGEGAASGAALAGGLGLLAAGGRAAAGAIGGSGGVSAADAALARRAIDHYRIPITAGDMTDNSLYRIAGDQAGKLPFSGAPAAEAAKRAAWQGAIAREMGDNTATRFTDDVMTTARNRIGAEFDRVAQNTSIDPTNTHQLVGDLGQIMHDAQAVPLPGGALPALQRQADDIVNIAAQGNDTISGRAYQAMTRARAPLDLAESSPDPNVRHVAGLMRDALDDAFARSASPADQQALTTARYQYRVMRTVQDLAAGSRDGNISPDAFMQKVLTASRRFDNPTSGMAYTGGGNIGELARIGKLMRGTQNSGTADRTLVNALTALGTTGAPALIDPSYAIGAPAVMLGNRFVGNVLRSPWMANQVIDRTLGGVPPVPQILAPGAAGATANTLALSNRR